MTKYEGMTKQELDETLASETLKNQTKSKSPKKTDLEAATRAMLKLNPEDRERVAKELCGLSSHEGGDGVGDVAKKNRDSLRPGGGTTSGDKKMPKLKIKEVDAFLESSLGPDLSPEFKERASEVFHAAISKASARAALEEIFNSDPIFSLLFADDEQIDVAQGLAERIEYLQGVCEELEQENQSLREENMRREIAEMQTIREEVLIKSDPLNRRSPSHNLQDDLEGVDESNRALLGEAGDDQRINDPKMRQYAAALHRSTSTYVDHSPAKPLIETFQAFK
jgi:hypothetical protein